jgi:hypothetical protein
MNPRQLALSRRFGALRQSTVFDSRQDLAMILAQFGLLPEPAMLHKVDRQAAVAILKQVLWKNLVDSAENMPEVDAERIAEAIVAEHSTDGSRYFSNRASAESLEWNPFTESTFESGLLIQNQDGVHFCIWFEEED